MIKPTEAESNQDMGFRKGEYNLKEKWVKVCIQKTCKSLEKQNKRKKEKKKNQIPVGAKTPSEHRDSSEPPARSGALFSDALA